MESKTESHCSKSFSNFSILGHLTGNDSQKYWNMQLNAIPEHKSFRNHNPEELVILGLYALKQIVDEFNKQTQLGEK